MSKKLLNRFMKMAHAVLTLLLLMGSRSPATASLFQDSVVNEPADSLTKIKNTASGFIPARVPVLYGGQSRERLVQSIGYLAGKQLETSPATNLGNALTGQLAGLYTSQSTGAPRFDRPDLSLRGRSPLIVVDGIPRYNLVNNGHNLYDILSVNPEQIESVTLLKDALSAVMLGNRAMDGILMITTRKNGIGSTPTIDVTVESGIQTPIGMRKSLSAYDYATLYNEAAANSGFAPRFTQEQLDGYSSGSNPLLFPDVDYREAIMKKNAQSQRYNVSAGGNYANVKYFVSLDYQHQQGLLREPADSVEQTNVDFKRFLVRSNIGLRLDKRLTADFNLMANIQDFYQPGVGYEAVFNSLLTTPNNAAPIYNTNGTFGGSQIYPSNPYAMSVASGHLQDNLQAAGADVILKRNMDDLIKGTWLKATLSYNPYYDLQNDRSRGFNAYDAGNGLRVNTISDRLNGSNVTQRFQQTYLELSTGIDRSWGKHMLTGLLLGSYENTQNNNQINQTYQNLAGNIAYTFDERINLEAGASYASNNRFAPGEKANFFPAGGISWNLHNESFFKNKFFNEFKLRATYGVVGNANPGYYIFRDLYVDGPAYFFGNATSTASVYEDVLPNYGRTVEKSGKLDLGLDMRYSRNRGWLLFDYYNNRQFDLLQVRGADPAILGQTYPAENIGKNRYYGFEATTGWADKIGKLNYSISGNISTVASEIIYNDEPAMQYDYMKSTGKPVNQIRGYVFEGLFNADNLGAPTIAGFTPSPGDARYRDLNSDGIINQYDQTVIGNDKPLIYYGGNLSLQYKGFDLSVLVQGVANRDILVTGNYEFPFNSSNATGQAWEYNLNRYTPATSTTATLPRVTLGVDNNNYITSSLFVRRANYLRLRNAEIGFSFSPGLLSRVRIKRLRVFVNGQNLATWSSYKESDPENYTGQYPIARIINGGLSVKL